MSFQKYDRILANLWFVPVSLARKDARDETLHVVTRFMMACRDHLKDDGIACLTSGRHSDYRATEEIIEMCGIEPLKTSVTKTHFDGKAETEWYLYSFDKQGKPAALNRL